VPVAPRSPLRVLHVTAVETSNYYLNNLARFTPGDDVRFLAATLGRPGAFVTDLHRLEVPAWALSARRRWDYPRAVWRLWQIVRREAVDILHLHLFEPTVLGLLVAMLARRPAIVTRHHSDAVHRLRPGLKKRVYSGLEGWINRRARHIVAPSQRVRHVLTACEGVSAAKVSLVPYGQLGERFDAIRLLDPLEVQRRLDVGSPLLVCVSRLHVEKGHAFLLEAFARLHRELPGATLCLVGEGPEREALMSSVRRLGLDGSVRFLGWRDDALQIMWAADLVVHPSLQEALPSAVIEAVMLGCPVVASDVSGVRDVLGDSEYGLVVPPGDADGLWRAMAETLRGRDQAREKAAQGRVHVSRYMDAERVAREHVVLYRAVAGERRREAPPAV
jgi:glycosyltransferase involved in cell wall biosynthesis